MNDDGGRPEPGSAPRRPGGGDPEPELWPGFHAGLPAPPEPSVTPPTPQGRRGGFRALLAASVVVLLLLSGGFGLWQGLVGGRIAIAPHGNGQADLGPTARSAATVVGPAVVDINTFARTFGQGSAGGRLTPEGAGTGLILTPSGEVLTNNHVIEGASSIQVTIPRRADTFTATVLGVDPSDDVALLQLQDASGLPTVTLGDPSTLSVGDTVVAIGNALGRGGTPTVTTGTVSALHRSIVAHDPSGTPEHLNDLIQTDANILPGDSGGALVNSASQVVGMITAGAASAGDRSGRHIGYAIPADAALNIVNEVRAGHGSSTILLGERGFLGVEVRNLDAASAARLGLNAASGALVVGVQPGSPADGAGITAPAVIVQIDGRAVASADALGPALHAHTPGDQVAVTWLDQAGSHTATVTLIAGGPAV